MCCLFSCVLLLLACVPFLLESWLFYRKESYSELLLLYLKHSAKRDAMLNIQPDPDLITRHVVVKCRRVAMQRLPFTFKLK